MAQAFDVSIGTITGWKKRYPSFLASIRGAKIIADARVAGSLYARAIGYEHEAVKIFMPEGHKDENGNPKPLIVPYTERYAPDTHAARFWLMNRQKDLWKAKQEVEIRDPLASMTPEARLAQVVDIMSRARALLASPDPEEGEGENITDAEYE